jgi:calcium binding protein 39
LLQAKKDVTALFNALLRYRPHPTSSSANYFPAVEYLSKDLPENVPTRGRGAPKRRPETLLTLVEGYEHKEIANNCGTVLRESFKHEALARVVLEDDRFWNFFDYVQGGSFDIASDAFSTFRVRQCQRTYI